MFLFKYIHINWFLQNNILDGFRKVSNIEHSGLKADGDEVEFYHPCFSLDNEEQLQYIKRKVDNSKLSVSSN